VARYAHMYGMFVWLCGIAEACGKDHDLHCVGLGPAS
jgi:hypothetical protein